MALWEMNCDTGEMRGTWTCADSLGFADCAHKRATIGSAAGGAPHPTIPDSTNSMLQLAEYATSSTSWRVQ